MNSRFTVSLAKTKEDLNAVFKLRYEDLVLEYADKDLPPYEEGLDKSPFDDYADHLMVKDNKTDEVVGYYRMIRSDALTDGKKFICEDEFDIDKLKRSDEKICEFSRAVIKKNHRGGIVLILLWKFILDYMRENGYRYLIGDASFFGTDRDAHLREISFLANSFPIEESWEVRSKDTLPKIQLLEKGSYDEEEALKSLPPLIKGYLNLGAKFSTDTFTDFPFGSVDVFVLADLKNANQEFLKKLENFNIS